MKFFYLRSLLLLSIFMKFLVFPIHAQSIDPQYIFIRKSAMHCIPDCSYLWNFDLPDNINTTTMLDVVNLVGASGTDQRKLGIGVEINYNHVYDFNRIKQSLQNLLYESEQNTVPVFINLNGVQWWGEVKDFNGNLVWNGRPDLWNWWDATQSGYNSGNVNNVEWTCWESSCAIKKAWRDWGGGEFEVRPQPNLASRAFIESSKARLAELVPIIVNWYKALPFDKEWLLGGVANGTEVDIGNNYRVYINNDIPHNDLAQTLQLGYAAVKTAGIRSSGSPPTSEELNEVIGRYLNELDKFAYDSGIPRSKIYNHTGGFDIFPSPFSSGLAFPTTSGALTQYGTPGWSFYGAVNTNPQNYSGLSTTLDQINNSEWASPEWNPLIPNDNNQYQNWVYALRNTLNFRNNRFINISNWEDTVRPNTKVLNAIKTVLGESPSCWVTTPQMENTNITGNNVTLTWQKGNNDHVYLYISNVGEFGYDGILTNKNIAQEIVTNTTSWSGNLPPGKYYWEFAADGCVDNQFKWQERTSDGSFVVAISSPTPIPPTLTPIPPTSTPIPSSTPIPPSPTSVLIPGDINHDGVVNIYDYNLLITDFGKSNSSADIDGNGKVDIYDYNTLIGNFGLSR